MTVIKIFDGGEVKPESESDHDNVPLMMGNSNHLEINRMLPFSPKLVYFTLNMALYSSLTFTSAYFFERWGLPIYQFGALSSLSIVELIGAVWWGGLADRTGLHRQILLACTWMYCGCFCLLPVAEWILPDEDAAGLKLAISTVLLGGTYFFMSSFFPLVDSCVLREIKKQNTNLLDRISDNTDISRVNGHVSFGKQRLWGTIGHAAISIISAQFISWFGWPGMFGVMILTCVAFSAIVYTIPDGLVESVAGIDIDNDPNLNLSLNPNSNIVINPPGLKTSINPVISNVIQSSESSNSHIEQGSWSFLFKIEFILFLFVVLLSGYMRSILSIFLPYHLLIDMHQTPMFVGLTALFRISAEIIIFAYAQTSSNAIGTRGGEVKLILMGLTAGVVRVAGYGGLEMIKEISRAPLWMVVFLLESMKGISVACLISGAVRLAHDLVPESASTRSQALVSGTYIT